MMPRATRQSEIGRPSPLSRQLAACDVVVLRLRRCCFSEAVGLIRRRGLVARRRIGQRSARRLAGKLCCLFLFPAKHRAPYSARAGAKLGWEQLVAETRSRWLIAVVLARLLFLGTAAGRQLIGPQGVLFAFALVADVATLLLGGFGFTASHVGIFRPCRVIGGGVGPLRWRQFAARWKHEGRTLLIVDGRLAVALEAEPFHDVAHEFLVDRDILVVGRTGGGGMQQSDHAERQPKGGARAAHYF